MSRKASHAHVFLALVSTLLVAIIAIPLAHLIGGRDFRLKAFWQVIVVLPLFLPPFVGAIGLRQLLGRFGTFNLMLIESGLIENPIDFLGTWKPLGIILLQAFHLYPIMYLQVVAARSQVRPSLLEAAAMSGAGAFSVWRSITFPLLAPAIYSSAVLIFIGSFTDLGTPLLFDYRSVIAVQIYDLISDVHENPAGYSLVIMTLLLTVTGFLLAKRFEDSRVFTIDGRSEKSVLQKLSAGATWVANVAIGLLVFLAFLPHAGVLLVSFAGDWFMTILPSTFTMQHYATVFSHPITSRSFLNSFCLSTMSAFLNLIIGVGVAWYVMRGHGPLKILLMPSPSRPSRFQVSLSLFAI